MIWIVLIIILIAGAALIKLGALSSRVPYGQVQAGS